ncbi:hypothetical protein EG829_25135 [bacterium]|nr:hypothetical protein [bacterium]
MGRLIPFLTFLNFWHFGARNFNFSRDAVKSAENCDRCGACIERCPYELPIPEMLDENLV